MNQTVRYESRQLMGYGPANHQVKPFVQAKCYKWLNNFIIADQNVSQCNSN